MQEMKVTYTHKGWFGVCPVYFSKLDTDCPTVDPRMGLYEPLMLLSEAMYRVVFFCCRAIRPDFDPAWPLKITGALSPNLTAVHKIGG